MPDICPLATFVTEVPVSVIYRTVTCHRSTLDTHQRSLTDERPYECKDSEAFPTKVQRGPQVEKLCR